MSAAEVEGVADGRIYTGRQALQKNLIDQLGGDDEARAWLEKTRGVSSALPVVDWKPSDGGWTEWGLARSSLAGLADLVGLPVVAAQIRQGRSSADLQALDGILAIWHPSLDH
jgi:protease-4